MGSGRGGTGQVKRAGKERPKLPPLFPPTPPAQKLVILSVCPPQASQNHLYTCHLTSQFVPPSDVSSPVHFLEWAVIRFLLRVSCYLQMRTDTIGPQGLNPVGIQPRVHSSTNTILPGHTRPPSSPPCLLSLSSGPLHMLALPPGRLFLPVSTLQMPPNHSLLRWEGGSGWGTHVNPWPIGRFISMYDKIHYK